MSFLGNALAAQPVADGPVEGFANNMPLEMVIKQIVPPDIPVIYGPLAKTAQPVNWRGGPSWQQALRDTVAQVAMVSMIEDGHVVIDLPPSPPPPPWHRQDHWEARVGQTLDQVTIEWGRRVGIKPVIRGTHQIPVDSPLSFDGDFQQALVHLVEAFSTAEPKPLLDIWEEGDNYAVVITEGTAP